MADVGPTRVLFVCTENAARSQMAEAILRSRGGDAFEVFSAGPNPGRLHPLAVEVMAEVDVDLSGQRVASVDAYRAMGLDYVVTLCRETRELSPSIRAQEMVIHQPFEDPAAAPEAEQRKAFRRVRDALTDWIDRLFVRPPPHAKARARAETKEP